MKAKHSNEAPLKQVVFVTGPAGAGRSTALRYLEDLGFEAVDNIPLSMILDLAGENLQKPLAIGLDTRNRDFDADRVIAMGEELTQKGFQASLLFLDADTDQLIKRYSETRRRHPLAPNDVPMKGIMAEASQLISLKKKADILIDTTNLSVHDLRDELLEWFSQTESHNLSVEITSFSYKRGLPREADLVLDVRYLNNPHWIEALRPLTGLNLEVQRHVKQDPHFVETIESYAALLLKLIPAYKEEGKSHLTIAVGCTGGRHRSVTVAEFFRERLAQEGWKVSVSHRELERLGIVTL